ncbi:MAG TPA: 16S rRNA (uracil(1498)-N(3))-methyltransferase [Alphaproteobacteria bacterium]|jgi:16S rRNA (uracil1498-N3)-methyltransferase|nr:16S rRNA (uracil(1498)-N(3))-methyltransferase [Alphaproteobacteria bacterium]
MIPRLYVTESLGAGGRVALGGDRTHYIKNVMRRAVGDEVGLFNGRDGEWLGHIGGYGKNSTDIVLDTERRPQAPGPDLWLVFAPIKRARIDFIAEKATELGVSVLWPVITRRSEPMRVNSERLTGIAIEAAEQTERLDIPEVREPVQLMKAMAAWPADRPLFACMEAGSAVPIAAAAAARRGSPAGVLIGPEGGFAPEELDALRKLPFVVPVGLGPRLLRAETAAIAALACWQALAGDGISADVRPPFRSEYVS